MPESTGRGHRDSGAPASTSPPTAQVRTAQVSVRIDKQVSDRAKNAFFGARQHASWKEYVEESLRLLAEDLERRLNNGKPFPARPHDKLSPGPPTR